jgi:hypothetical protein
MVEIPCDMMDSGKPCRKAIGESRAGLDSVACLCAPGDWTPASWGESLQEQEDSIIRYVIQREFRCLIGEPTPSSPRSASDLLHKIG